MKAVYSIIFLAMFGLYTALAGCGGADVTNQNTTVSKGQQLIDLQKAYKSGAITKEEFEDQKKQVLDD